MVESLTQPQNATPQEQQKADLLEKTEKMKAILAEIVSKNDEVAVKAGLDLLMRLIGNVIDKPTETKFRTIKSSNAKLQKEVFSLQGGISDLIVAMGFQKTDAEHFVFVGDYFKVIQKGRKLTEDALAPINYKFMTPEEQKKWDVLQEQKRIYQAEQEKKKAIIAEQKRLQEYDAKEKATQEVVASKANKNLKPFGSEKGVFKAPEPRGG